jgi:hypothetical protein
MPRPGPDGARGDPPRACPKVGFGTRAEAERAARGLSARRFGGWRGAKPFVRAYRCPVCSSAQAGVWHMTRSKARQVK